MPESLTRFPIRCGWALPGGFDCDRPAVLSALIRFDCGCPDGDATACASCAEELPVGHVASGRNQKCIRCGAFPAGYTITAHRPLNEGDLP